MDAHAVSRRARHDPVPDRGIFRGKESLTLYNYEGNQFARLVREALCELEVPYVLYNCGKGSPRRETLRGVAEGRRCRIWRIRTRG